MPNIIVGTLYLTPETKYNQKIISYLVLTVDINEPLYEEY